MNRQVRILRKAQADLLEITAAYSTRSPSSGKTLNTLLSKVRHADDVLGGEHVRAVRAEPAAVTSLAPTIHPG
jgi:hypothetical protein